MRGPNLTSYQGYVLHPRERGILTGLRARGSPPRPCSPNITTSTARLTELGVGNTGIIRRDRVCSRSERCTDDALWESARVYRTAGPTLNDLEQTHFVAGGDQDWMDTHGRLDFVGLAQCSLLD